MVEIPGVAGTPRNITPSIELVEVELVAGEGEPISRIKVMGLDEAEWFNHHRDRYVAQLRLTAQTDLADLNRLLMLELLVFRGTQWLAQGCEYDSNLVDAKELNAQLQKNSAEIGKVKEQMGLTKAARDRDISESVGAYVVKLKQAAKEFGIHRQNQAAKAIALMKELESLVGTYDRSNATERRKIGLESPEDILKWCRQVAFPEFNVIDEVFRKNKGRYYVRELAQ